MHSETTTGTCSPVGITSFKGLPKLTWKLGRGFLTCTLVTAARRLDELLIRAFLTGLGEVKLLGSLGPLMEIWPPRLRFKPTLNFINANKKKGWNRTRLD